MPDVIVLCDALFSQVFLNLEVAVCDYAVQCDTTCLQKSKASLQTFLLHVVTPSNLIALLIENRVDRGKRTQYEIAGAKVQCAVIKGHVRLLCWGGFAIVFALLSSGGLNIFGNIHTCTSWISMTVLVSRFITV